MLFFSAWVGRLNRSVPCCDQLVQLSGLLGRRFVSPGTNLYDLGCSLGAVALSLLGQVPDRSCRFLAVESSSAMIEALTARLREAGFPHWARWFQSLSFVSFMAWTRARTAPSSASIRPYFM